MQISRSCRLCFIGARCMLNPNNPESLENDLSLVFLGQSEFWGVGRRSLCFFQSSLGEFRSIVCLEITGPVFHFTGGALERAVHSQGWEWFLVDLWSSARLTRLFIRFIILVQILTLSLVLPRDFVSWGCCTESVWGRRDNPTSSEGHRWHSPGAGLWAMQIRLMTPGHS